MLDNLRKKIETNIEVEDLIELAVKKQYKAIPILDKAIIEKEWEDHITAATTKKVPLKTWALVVMSYLEKGCTGLKRYTDTTNGSYLETSRFVISVLQEIKCEETLKNLIFLFSDLIDDPSIDKNLSDKLISAINFLLSFKPYLNIDSEVQVVLRRFVLKYLSLYGDAVKDRATAFCALRGVGNLESIDIIKSYPKLTEPYKGLEGMVIKVIKSRN